MAKNTIHVIGAGGVATYLLPPLVATNQDIIVWDGDHYEEKNLSRQFFDARDVGMNKAEALAKFYGGRIRAVPRYFSEHEERPFKRGDVVFVCVDNHAARKYVLRQADACRVRAVIVAANEYVDAQSYIYFPHDMDSALDPRVRFPDILTDTSDDPTRPRSCTGDAVESAPQLAYFNHIASALALHLYYLHVVGDFSDVDDDFKAVQHDINFNRAKTIAAMDFLPVPTNA